MLLVQEMHPYGFSKKDAARYHRCRYSRCIRKKGCRECMTGLANADCPKVNGEKKRCSLPSLLQLRAQIDYSGLRAYH
jgi:coenzyme F420-reducing hydrogenase gamma subunit